MKFLLTVLKMYLDFHFTPLLGQVLLHRFLMCAKNVYEKPHPNYTRYTR